MMASKSFVFRFGDMEVREREFTLIKAGEVVPVEPKAFRVLLLLLRNPQKLIAKEELLNAVWGDAAVTENSLTRSIALLRKLLGDDTRSPRYIETVATVGYRFVCKVDVSEEASGILDPTDQRSANGSSVGASAAAEMETDLKRLRRDLDPGLASVSSTSVARAGATEEVRRGRRRVAMLAGAAGLVLLLALAYVLRPAVPPPRMIAIKQITHDGLTKVLAGDLAGIPLFTDGSRVYFSPVYPAQPRILQVSTGGGESMPVPIPFALTVIFGTSPSKSELLLGGPPFGSVASTAALWGMPVLGGQARQIGDLQATDATWSPDGASIYYAQGSDIWVARSDGSQARKILTANGTPSWIRFSPDGRLIRFSVQDLRLNTSALWEAQIDGSQGKRLLSGDAWSNECCGVWTPDGKYFVFQSTRGISSTLWAIREKREWWRKTNTEPVQLTTGEMISASPLASEDGKNLFFVGATRRGELVRFDIQKRSFVP
jgi:DNA-binding winged helix-turn-helix (wHTH) protein